MGWSLSYPVPYAVAGPVDSLLYYYNHRQHHQLLVTHHHQCPSPVPVRLHRPLTYCGPPHHPQPRYYSQTVGASVPPWSVTAQSVVHGAPVPRTYCQSTHHSYTHIIYTDLSIVFIIIVLTNIAVTFASWFNLTLS